MKRSSLRFAGRPSTREAYDFFHKSTLVFSKIEAAGIKVDTKYLNRAIKRLGKEIADTDRLLKEDKVWTKHWSRRFKNPNLDSVSQLGTVLTEMGYESKEKTDKGNAKWDERALDAVPLDFARNYVANKKLKKAHGTYLLGIRRETVNGFLHPSYNLAGGLEDEQKGGAMSYRSSSSNPNFTNMPIRNKRMSELIRQCFVARDGRRLVEIDFSTLEVRIAACCCLDPNLIAYIKDKSRDMHRDSAMKLFFLLQHEVGKKTTRDAAKNKFVFPQFYGSFYPDCAKAMWESMLRAEWQVEGSEELVRDRLRKHGVHKLGKYDKDDPRPPVPGTFMHHVKEVQDYLWTKMFPVYNKWRRDWYDQYLETGVVPMHTGFTATGHYRRNQVINLPVQGPAYHCLQWSINEIVAEMERRRMKSQIVGLIHDCLLGDVVKSEVQEFLNLAEDVMTRRLAKAWDWICVPLEIEVDVVPKGKSWYDKQPWDRNEHGVWAAKA